MFKSRELKLFQGKEVEFVTKRQVSTSHSDSQGYSERTYPMVLSGYLIGETSTSWLIGENDREIAASIEKDDVSSIQLIFPKSATMDLIVEQLFSNKLN